jgi:hypothetical protein
MQPLFAEKRVTVKLGGGEELLLVFNANTFAAFEDQTGKFYLDTVARLFDAVKPSWEARKAKTNGAPMPGGEDDYLAYNPMVIFRHVPMKEILALVWAATHNYDKDDIPTWPYTIGQIGRMIHLTDIPPIVVAFMQGQTANSPTKAELGESPAPLETPIPVREQLVNGGERSIGLPEDAFT